MNRIIKFRAWDKKYKKFWGDFQIFPDGFVAPATKQKEGHWIYDYEYPQKNIILQQFTGVKDKNGKEIFEGDIINWISGYKNGNEPIYEPREVCFYQVKDYPNRIVWILWSEEEKENKEAGIFNIWELKEIEIIGNIFETEKIK